MTLSHNGPTLLFIGRDRACVQAWREVRRLWQFGRAVRASGAYRGMALLAGYRDVRVAVVAVDNLSPGEMSFFASARRCRPDVHLLALGRGDERSNPRLSQACSNGAQQAVNSQSLAEKLRLLRNHKPSATHTSGLKPLASSLRPLPQGPQNLMARRNVAKARRKAPSSAASQEPPARSSGELVTAEELRVLLGQDGEEPCEPKESKK